MLGFIKMDAGALTRLITVALGGFWLYPASGAGLLPAGSDATVIDYPENRATRVTAFTPAQAQWSLSGEDAARFSVAHGVLRFAREGRRAFRPDFEAPRDADGDNRFRLVAQAQVDGDEVVHEIVVQVGDRDEPGRVRLDSLHPVQGEPVTAALQDPDGALEDVAWRWERSVGIEQWQEIPGALQARYTPQAGDTGRHLRAVASYVDRHGIAEAAGASPNPVLGPRLASLEVLVESDPEQVLRPAFDPKILHYGIACTEPDVLVLKVSVAPGVRLAVNGARPAGDAVAVAVSVSDDVTLSLDSADGGHTRYTLHCMPSALAAIRTHSPPGARPLESLLAVAAGAWVAVIDGHGIPRVQRHTEAPPGNAGFFLLPFGEGEDRRWAYAEPGSALEWGWKVLAEWAWVVLDRAFSPLLKVDTAPPLRATARHDFRLLEDGAMLLMGYEPAALDFSPLNAWGLAGPEGEPWEEETETRDSVIQVLEPDGRIRWSWGAWGRLPLEDCTQRSFPHDFAHLDAIAPVRWAGEKGLRDGVLASFRDCSSVLLLDPEAPAGEEIVWRIGQSNLNSHEWAERGLGPVPLRVAGDPEGAFCSQHAAQLLPNGNLLLFDNGVACVVDPGTRAPLSRPGETFSRAVEYALDLEHGEAVFVRDHALAGRHDVLNWIGGHVAVLDNGDWLVSWGRGRTEAAPGTVVPDDIVTRVDPETGEESFSILQIRSEDVPGGTVRAVPVPALALSRNPGSLAGSFPDLLPEFHEGPDSRLAIEIAFSRAVADFGVETPSIQAEGATLAAVEPELAPGKPTHGYRLIFEPDGDAPLTLRFLEHIACEAGGICAADGTKLSAVPAAALIPFENRAR